MTSTEQDRRKAVAEAVANLRASGFDPEPEFEELLERYVRGEISLDDIRRATREAFRLPKPDA